MELLSGKEVRKMEPHLSPKVCLGMYSLSDSFIDSRLVLKALKIMNNKMVTPLASSELPNGGFGEDFHWYKGNLSRKL